MSRSISAVPSQIQSVLLQTISSVDILENLLYGLEREARLKMGGTDLEAQQLGLLGPKIVYCQICQYVRVRWSSRVQI